MWSPVAIHGSPKLLIIDASDGTDNWEALFGMRLFNALNRKIDMVGTRPLKIKLPTKFPDLEEQFQQANCIFLFVRGGVNEPPSWSRLMDYWSWLNTNVHEPKLFVGCAWEDYHPKMSQMILKQETHFAPIALVPEQGVTAREIGLFSLKFFAELGLHSNDEITGKMAWFSTSKAKEMMKRRGLDVKVGLRC